MKRIEPDIAALTALPAFEQLKWPILLSRLGNEPKRPLIALA